MINAQESTVRRLPAEVMVNIFEMACAVDADLSRRFICEDDLFPWKTRDALSMTCSFWRRVVYSTPSLWNHLVLRDIPRDAPAESLALRVKDRSFVPHPELIRVAMEQARSYPLHTHVICKSKNQAANEAYWRKILPHITQAISRSRVVHVNLYTLPKSLTVLTSSPLPKLRYLWLEWRFPQRNAGFLDLSRATSLSLLSIWDPSLGFEAFFRLRLPEECQIRWLRLAQVVFTDTIEAVTRCASHLESLCLEHWDRADGENSLWTRTLAKLYFPRLHHLHLQGILPSSILHAIVAPELKSLDIHRNSGLAPHRLVLPDIQQFPRLRSLIISCDAIESVLIPFLRAHPVLETVGLVTLAVAKRILSTENMESKTPLLPRLSSLWISCDDMQVEDAEACAVIRRLAEDIRPGCSLHLHTRSDSEFRRELRILARESPGQIHPPVCHPSQSSPLQMIWPEDADNS